MCYRLNSETALWMMPLRLHGSMVANTEKESIILSPKRGVSIPLAVQNNDFVLLTIFKSLLSRWVTEWTLIHMSMIYINVLPDKLMVRAFFKIPEDWQTIVSVQRFYSIPLQWRHNKRDGVSNHQPHNCLLNRLFRRKSKKTSKLCVTGLCEGNSPVTGEFPAQRASNAENVSICLPP